MRQISYETSFVKELQSIALKITSKFCIIYAPGKASRAICHVKSGSVSAELGQLQEAETEMILKGATRTISSYHFLCRGGR